MISQEEIKYFSAVTYGNNKYHFAVTPKNEIYCCEFDTNIPANLLELKPNFVLRDQSRRTIFTLVDYLKDKNRYSPDGSPLIREYIIDDELFEYLIKNNMIIYSTDMAKLYGFDPKYAHDAHYQTRAFKHYRYNPNGKTKILSRQKQGKFH